MLFVVLRPAVQGERQAEMLRSRHCSVFAVTFYDGFLCHVGMGYAAWLSHDGSMALWLYGSMALWLYGLLCEVSRSRQQTERSQECVWNNMTLVEYVGVFVLGYCVL